MRTWLQAQSWPAGMTPQERQRKQRLMSTILWMQLGMTALIGVVDALAGMPPRAVVLFAAAAVAIPGMLLNRRGYYVLAASLTTVAVLTVIDVILYTTGGIHDRILMALPIFIMLGPLLFSRRSLPYFTLTAMASVIGLGLMEMSTQTAALATTTLVDIVLICLMLIGGGLIVWLAIGGLEENLRRARDSEIELRRAYDSTLEGWSRALGYRDTQTHGHTQRVVRLCMRLAKEWGFSDEQLEHIYRGALLHDIGKMAVPDEILLKAGPLTPSEWKVMRQHPTVAGELLRHIPYLRPALGIPVYHHERWDGKGYPRGIKGPRIPLEARIFAVVDQYDALRSRRPYRRAWPREKALAYVRENAGRTLDPDVCKVFLQLLDGGAFGGAV